MHATHHLAIDERLDAAGQAIRGSPLLVRLALRSICGGMHGRHAVLLGKAVWPLVLVIDDHGLLVGINVHAVDGAANPSPGVFHRLVLRTKVPLEEARLEAYKEARLVVERGLEVVPELFKLRLVCGVVGNKGLVAAALSLAQTLVAKVLLKLGEKDLVRVRKARRIVLKHARARKHDPRVEVVALAYPRALARLGEQPRVSDLQHAVRKGAHLHWAKAGIGVLQAKTPQTEPLVRALEVRLDLRCREERLSLH